MEDKPEVIPDVNKSDKNIEEKDITENKSLKRAGAHVYKPRKRRKLTDRYCDDSLSEDDELPRKTVVRETSSVVSTDSSANSYQLRPRSYLRRPATKRELSDDGELSPDPTHPPKSRSSQLSKYRRRTANARERHRMKEINDAFATLRGVLPSQTQIKDSSLTKITTLRMAVDYIQALDDLLNQSDFDQDVFGSSEDLACSDNKTESSICSYEDLVIGLTSGALNSRENITERNQKKSIFVDDQHYNYTNALIDINGDSHITEDSIAFLLSNEIDEPF